MSGTGTNVRQQGTMLTDGRGTIVGLRPGPWSLALQRIRPPTDIEKRRVAIVDKLAVRPVTVVAESTVTVAF